MPTYHPPLTQDEVTELRRLAPQTKETARAEGTALLAELREAVGILDPRSLIALASWLNIWGAPDEYFEPGNRGSETKLELLAGLAISQRARSSNEAGPHDYQVAMDLADEVIARIDLMLLAEAAAAVETDPRTAQLAYFTRMRRLHVRGESFADHAETLVLEVFEPYEAVLGAGLGFAAEDLILFFHAVTGVDQDEVNRVLEREFARLEDALDQGMQATQESERSARAEEARDCLDSLHVKLGHAMTFTVEQVLANEPSLSRDAAEAILAAFSLAIGDCDPAEYTWPLDEHPLARRPILALEDGYMVPVPGFIGRDYVGLMAAAVADVGTLPLPSDYLALACERCALTLMRRIFLSSECYGLLYYRIGGQRFDTDGLVLCEHVAIVTEAKARRLSPKATRGDVRRLEADLRDAVTDGLKQGERLAGLLLSGQTVSFENQKGEIVLDVAPGQVTEVHVLNPHLTPILDLGARPAVLAAAGVTMHGSSAVPIFMNDLRMIMDFVETPAEFIDYLRWRANQPLEQLIGFDEGDLFGAYLLNEDFGFLEGRPARLQGYFTTQFDDYYTVTVNARPRGPKPRKMIPKLLTSFVRSQCDARSDGWLDAATAVLSLGIAGFAFVDVKTLEVAARARRDKAAHMLVYGSCALVAMPAEMTWQEALALTESSMPPDVTHVVFVSQGRNRAAIRWALRR
jgi:hypothetical protein